MDLGKHRLTHELVEIQAEEVFGHGICIEEPAGAVHGDHAAANVEQDVRGLKPGVRQFSFRTAARLLQLATKVGAPKRDEGEHCKLPPHLICERGIDAEDRVRHIQDVAKQGDEQAPVRRQQQRCGCNDEDVEGCELRSTSRIPREMHDCRDEQQVEDRLEVEEVGAELSLLPAAHERGHCSRDDGGHQGQ